MPLLKIWQKLGKSLQQRQDKKAMQKIVHELEYEGFYELGPYTRLYPYTLEKTTGMFVINFSEYVFLDTGKFDYAFFDIVGEENRESLETTTIEHDKDAFCALFKDREKALAYMRQFILKFPSPEALYQHVVKSFGFEQKARVLVAKKAAFDLIKDDLPDGTDFDDFVDGSYL